MKNIKRIHTKGIDFQVGVDGVEAIYVYEQKKNGNILYQVIKDGKSIFVSAYDMKEEY